MPTLIKNSDGTLLRNSNGTIANDQNCCCEEEVCSCPWETGESADFLVYVDSGSLVSTCTGPFHAPIDLSSCFPLDGHTNLLLACHPDIDKDCEVDGVSVSLAGSITLFAGGCPAGCSTPTGLGCCWHLSFIQLEPDDCGAGLPYYYVGYKCYDSTDATTKGMEGTYTQTAGTSAITVRIEMV